MVGKEFLEGYVAIEADRMRNLWLREEDRQPEMTVVRNEFEQGENDPQQALDVEINAAAIIAHPYHHSTIGWRSDIENVPIEKLRAFYDTYYWPNNATVSVIGDFEPAAVLELIKKYYASIPRSPQPIPQVYTTEPEQQGERRVTVRRAGELGIVGIAYKSVAGRDPDYPGPERARDDPRQRQDEPVLQGADRREPHARRDARAPGSSTTRSCSRSTHSWRRASSMRRWRRCCSRRSSASRRTG